jgi:anthranilate/para-aminobenzoate synthase component II
VQFHAESILTEHGSDLIRQLMVDLLSRQPEARPG